MAILGAKLATEVAGRATQAIGEALGREESGFAAVLRSNDAEGAKSGDPETLLNDLIAAIQDRLAGIGIPRSTEAMNPPLQVRVTQSGFHIEGGHERAAEIEDRLNSDHDLVDLAGKLAKAGGSLQFTLEGTDKNVRLTGSNQPANITDLLGG